MSEIMPKVTEAVKIRESKNLGYHIQVDGGIDANTNHLASQAGANVLVAGSSTFGAPDMQKAILSLRK